MPSRAGLSSTNEALANRYFTGKKTTGNINVVSRNKTNEGFHRNLCPGSYSKI